MKVSAKLKSKKLSSRQMQQIKGGQTSPSASLCPITYDYEGSATEFSEMLRDMEVNPSHAAQAELLKKLYNNGCVSING